MNKKQQIELIKKELGLDESTIRQMGIGPLMTQVAARRGMPDVLRCDADSGDTGQYTGDLEKDLKPKTNRGEGSGKLG